MKSIEIPAKNNKKIWISLTGYRILLILSALIQKGHTVKELIEILSNNEFTNNSLSKDTIRVAINTLKNAGCNISRPTKANDYKYELISHPFTLSLSENELNIFLRLRNKMINEMDWQEVFELNALYEKIISLTFNEEQINLTKETAPFAEVEKSILQEISNPQIIGKKVRIIYDSPQFGDEEIHIIPQKLSYENAHIYLWCYSFKYNKNSLLSIERIKKIVSYGISKQIESTKVLYDVIYSLTGKAINTFEAKEFEEIIEKKENEIKILAHVENEFYFIQRILLFGADFKIISPDFFREKLINKIKLIQKGYNQ